MLLVTRPESDGRLFRRQVPLRFGEHFKSKLRCQFLTLLSGCHDVPDKEFTHAGATQQWRVEVQV